MSTKADIKALRGTKRSCQNEQCGARFYDLNQDPITCPVCQTVYVIPISPPISAFAGVSEASEEASLCPR